MAAAKPSRTFWIDMNGVSGDRAETLLTLASDPVSAQLFPPSIGELVVITTEEGDLCDATVTDESGIWLELALNWDTWLPAPIFETVRAPQRVATFSKSWSEPMKKVQEYKSLTANPAGNLVIKETGKPSS